MTELTMNDRAARERRGFALAVIAAAQLMVMLDLTIVNVALPSIQSSLHFSVTNLTWVIDAYVLVFGGLLLLGGRAGDIFGRRRMFYVGIGLFALASLAGGLATSQLLLVSARAVQGVGANGEHAQQSFRSALHTVADALTAHGFAAHADQRNNQLRIINNHCPFGDVAIDNPVICAVDRGMVKGMLKALYGDTDPSIDTSLPLGDDYCVTSFSTS